MSLQFWVSTLFFFCLPSPWGMRQSQLGGEREKNWTMIRLTSPHGAGAVSVGFWFGSQVSQGRRVYLYMIRMACLVVACCSGLIRPATRFPYMSLPDWASKRRRASKCISIAMQSACYCTRMRVIAGRMDGWMRPRGNCTRQCSRITCNIQRVGIHARGEHFLSPKEPGLLLVVDKCNTS